MVEKGSEYFGDHHGGHTIRAPGGGSSTVPAAMGRWTFQRMGQLVYWAKAAAWQQRWVQPGAAADANCRGCWSPQRKFGWPVVGLTREAYWLDKAGLGSLKVPSYALFVRD